MPQIECGEHKPDAELPDYPAAPATEDVESIRAYSKAQSHWAVVAAGIVGNEYALRNGTAKCLDNLRSQGIIH